MRYSIPSISRFLESVEHRIESICVCNNEVSYPYPSARSLNHGASQFRSEEVSGQESGGKDEIRKRLMIAAGIRLYDPDINFGLTLYVVEQQHEATIVKESSC
jgi:hypothetical protein